MKITTDTIIYASFVALLLGMIITLGIDLWKERRK